MKNNIYNFALLSNKIDVNALCEMCDLMDEGMRDRFVNAVLGIVDFNEVIENLPKTSKYYEKTRRLVSVNYLTGIIQYEYDDVITRYFRTEEEAKRFAEEGRGKWDGNGKKDDEHPFEATHTFLESGSCEIYEWENERK